MDGVDFLIGVVDDVLHTAVILQSIDGSAAFVQIVPDNIHIRTSEML